MMTIFKVRCSKCYEELIHDEEYYFAFVHIYPCLCLSEDTGILMTVENNIGYVEGNKNHCQVWMDSLNCWGKFTNV